MSVSFPMFNKRLINIQKNSKYWFGSKERYHQLGSFGCCRHEWVNIHERRFTDFVRFEHWLSWILEWYESNGCFAMRLHRIDTPFRYFVMYSLLLVCKDNWLQWENQITFLHSKKTSALDNQMNIFLLCKYQMQILLLKTLPLKPTWPCKIKTMIEVPGYYVHWGA